jgi:hypothetical protein
MSSRAPAPENTYPCSHPPDFSPDTVANKAQQRAASAILNTVYEYEQATGKKYKFKSNEEHLLFKMAKMRQGNVLADPERYANAPTQSTLTLEQLNSLN